MFNTIRDEFKKTQVIPKDEDNENILKDIGEFDQKFAEGIIDKIKLYQTMQERGLKQTKSKATMKTNLKKFEEEKSFEQRKAELALRDIEEREKNKFDHSDLIARVNFDPMVTGIVPQDYYKDHPEIEKKVLEEMNSKRTLFSKGKTSPGRSPKRSISMIKSEPMFSATKWMKTEYHHPGIYVKII